MNQTEKLLEFLCQRIRQMTPDYKITSCLAYSTIGKAVLKNFGVKAKIHVSQFSAMSDITYKKLMDGEKPDPSVDYILGVPIEPLNDQGVGGHFFLEIEGGYLLDLAADQFSRPNRGVKGTRFWRSPGQFRVTNGEIHANIGPDTMGVYEIRSVESSPNYQKSRDRKPQRHWRAIQRLTDEAKKL